MELDTGSSVSVISEADYVKYFKGEKLEKSLLVLKTYSGEKLHSLGVHLSAKWSVPLQR
jgi:hypothetical protein